MVACWWLFYCILLHMIILITSQTFGYNDSLTCHCNVGTCNTDSGVCSLGCQQGWSGPSCQKENVALNKPASQSSYYRNDFPGINDTMISGFGVDGDRSNTASLGLDPGHSKCADMQRSIQGWWSVDLQQTYPINTIKIYYRNHDLQSRLQGFSIYVIKEDMSESLCYQHTVEPLTDVFAIRCQESLPGTGVIFYSARQQPGILNLCEVEIYVCFSGTFGSDCNNFCHCSNHTRCDDVTGSCLTTGCLSGWSGASCNQNCSMFDAYGDGCLNKCTDRKCKGTSDCDHVTGSCRGGCEAGWTNGDCTQKCTEGFYGVGCVYKCTNRKCKRTSDCDHVTGSCIDGCTAGWVNDDCTQKCAEGFYGDGCLKNCTDRKCKGTSDCDHVTGICVDGCEAGWIDGDCTKTCDASFYGNGCRFNCSERMCVNVTSSSCDHMTGQCDEGCEAGYDGKDCTFLIKHEKTSVGSTDKDNNDTPVIVGSVCGVILLLGLIITVIILYRKGVILKILKAKGNNSPNIYDTPTAQTPDVTYDGLTSSSIQDNSPTDYYNTGRDYYNISGATTVSHNVPGTAYYNTGVATESTGVYQNTGTATTTETTGVYQNTAASGVARTIERGVLEK